MLALYRPGRQAEALRVFQELRGVLVAELGIEPGHDVTWMEHAILAQDPALDFAAPPEDVDRCGPRRDAAAPELQGPRPGLPARRPLVGRALESALLRDWWASGPQRWRRAAPCRRRPRHRQDAPRGEAGSYRRDRGRTGLCGAAATRTQLRRSSPSLRRSAGLPGPVGGPDLDHARVAADGAVPARPAPPRIRPASDGDRGDLESERYRFFEAVTATLHDLRRAGRCCWWSTTCTAPISPPFCCCVTSCATSTTAEAGVVGSSSTPRSRRPPARAKPGRCPVGALGRDRAPSGARRRGGGGIGRELAQGPGGLGAAAPQADRRQPVVPRGDARRSATEMSRAATDGDSPVRGPESHRGDPGAGGTTRVASARGRDLPVAGGGRGGAPVRSEHRGRSRRVEPGPAARRLQPRGGVAPAAPHRMDVRDRYAFTHGLVRDAIYGELLRGRRVRYHHKIALATERVHADDSTDTSTSSPTTSTWERRWRGPTRPPYCLPPAGRPAPPGLRGSGGPFTRAASRWPSSSGTRPVSARGRLIALAEAQNRAGDTCSAEATSGPKGRAGSAQRRCRALGGGALWSGPRATSESCVSARNRFDFSTSSCRPPRRQPPHLRAMVLARLGLVVIYATDARTGTLAPACPEHEAWRWRGVWAIGWCSARADARMHALWGVGAGAGNGWRPASRSGRSPTTSATSSWAARKCGASANSWC